MTALESIWTQQQADHSDPQSLVWYAAYGQNTMKHQFDAYLAVVGGPAPKTWRPIIITGGLYFARPVKHPYWGVGGTAYYDFFNDGQVLARSWLITREQFDAIYALRNGFAPGTPLATIQTGPYGRIHDLSYMLRGKESFLGAPQYTFTAQKAPSDLALPSRKYLMFIQQGLRETHGMDRHASAKYLMKHLPSKGS